MSDIKEENITSRNWNSRPIIPSESTTIDIIDSIDSGVSSQEPITQKPTVIKKNTLENYNKRLEKQEKNFEFFEKQQKDFIEQQKEDFNRFKQQQKEDFNKFKKEQEGQIKKLEYNIKKTASIWASFLTFLTTSFNIVAQTETLWTAMFFIVFSAFICIFVACFIFYIIFWEKFEINNKTYIFISSFLGFSILFFFFLWDSWLNWRVSKTSENIIISNIETLDSKYKQLVDKDKNIDIFNDDLRLKYIRLEREYNEILDKLSDNKIMILENKNNIIWWKK